MGYNNHMKRILPVLFIILLVIIGIVWSKSLGQKNVDKQITDHTTTEKNDWKQYNFDDIHLTFSAPSDLQVTMEKVDETFILTLQKSAYPKPDYYQLYGIYHVTDPKTINKSDLKKELNETGIEETTIDGMYTLKGQYKGERNRFVTIIVTDKGLFTLATSQPTEENKKITDSLLATFDFK
jgi:hypothetical protein